MEKSGSYIMTSLRKTILDFSCNSSGMPFDPGPFNLRSGVIFFFPSLTREEKIIDYRDKGRGHERRLEPFNGCYSVRSSVVSIHLQSRFDPRRKLVRFNLGRLKTNKKRIIL